MEETRRIEFKIEIESSKNDVKVFLGNNDVWRIKKYLRPTVLKNDIIVATKMYGIYDPFSIAVESMKMDIMDSLNEFMGNLQKMIDNLLKEAEGGENNES